MKAKESVELSGSSAKSFFPIGLVALTETRFLKEIGESSALMSVSRALATAPSFMANPKGFLYFHESFRIAIVRAGNG